jgi:hypothetical protein
MLSVIKLDVAARFFDTTSFQNSKPLRRNIDSIRI